MKKRIAIDSYPISTPYVGLGEFCKQICTRLSERAEELRKQHSIELYFIVPPRFKGCYGHHVHYIGMPAKLRRIIPIYPLSIDLFHIPYQTSKLSHMLFSRKQLLTIHDVNFMYEKTGKGLQRAIKRFNYRLQHTDYINYISKFACEDTERYFHLTHPKRVIYNGVTDLSTSVNRASLPQGLPDKFLFHLSSLQPKKNIHLLIKMMKSLPDYNLVIAGSWDNEYALNLRTSVLNSGSKNIFMLSNVSEAEKATLYKSCSAFLFPSMCEGFGLPPIEAMKLGKPVFLSTMTSLPEIGGDAAFYWDELEPETMAQVLRERMDFFHATPSYPEKLRLNADRFDWDRCVEQYIDYYIDILAQ